MNVLDGQAVESQHCDVPKNWGWTEMESKYSIRLISRHNGLDSIDCMRIVYTEAWLCLPLYVRSLFVLFLHNVILNKSICYVIFFPLKVDLTISNMSLAPYCSRI
jgi:hypothetical protein